MNKKNKKTKKEYVMIDRLNDCLLGHSFTVISEDLPPKVTSFAVISTDEPPKETSFTVISEEDEK